MTLAQEYQQLAYSLFQKYLFNLDGVKMKGPDSLETEFISKAELLDKSIELLNELGQLIADDRRLQNEIDAIEDSSLPPETEKD